jgi:Tfp pilus assembly protein PilF
MNHVPATRENVVTLLESRNQPLVNIPNVGTANTRAFVLGTRGEHNLYTVFVCLRQDQTGALLVYASEPRDLNASQYRIEENEALRFVESMGFQMENLGFRALAPEQQRATMLRLPIFKQTQTIDLVELEEEPVDRGFGVDFMPGSAFVPPAPPPAAPPSRRGVNFPSPALPVPALAKIALTGVPIIQGSTIEEEPEPDGFPVPDPAEPTAAPLDPMARLGRLLATFALLAVVALPRCHDQHRPGDPLPQAVQAQLDLAEQQIAQGLWSDSVATLLPVIEDAPTCRDALNWLGLAYLNLGKDTEAEGYLRRAVDADPKWSVPKNTLASLLIRTSRCEEAARMLNKVLEDIFYPTPEFAEHNLARAEFCLGRKRDAVRRLESLSVKRPQFCLGYLTLADMSAEEKLPEVTIKACDDFENQCEKQEEIKKLVSPEHSCLCYLRKGMAYAQLGDVQAARQAFANCNSDGAYGRECKRSLELLPPE